MFTVEIYYRLFREVYSILFQSSNNRRWLNATYEKLKYISRSNLYCFKNLFLASLFVIAKVASFTRLIAEVVKSNLCNYIHGYPSRLTFLMINSSCKPWFYALAHLHLPHFCFMSFYVIHRLAFYYVILISGILLSIKEI